MARKQKPLTFHNFKELDRVLSNIEKNIGEKMIYSALGSGASKVKNSVEAAVPVSQYNTRVVQGKDRVNSTRINKGDLRAAVKKGLTKKMDKGKKNTFGAFVTFDGDKGWFAPFVYWNHKPNAFGFTGNYMPRFEKSVNKAEPQFISIVGVKLAAKIAKNAQDKINKL